MVIVVEKMLVVMHVAVDNDACGNGRVYGRDGGGSSAPGGDGGGDRTW